MKRSPRFSIGKLLFNLFFVLPLMIAIQIPIMGAGALLGAVLVYSDQLPESPQLKHYQPKTVSTFYADDGTVIGEFSDQKRYVVQLDKIPDHVIETFLGAEDDRFYQHNGIDWLALVRAAIANVKAGGFVQGGSTITMQVARNMVLADRSKSISRKLKEMILARRIERAWGKDKILYIYLNEIFLGDQCYGVEAAARNYFGKSVEELTAAEAAVIAGLISSPSRWHPFVNEEKAISRQRTVLRRMLEAGFLTEKEYQEAKNQKLVFHKETLEAIDLVPDFTAAVRRYIVDKYGKDELNTEGLKVYTTCRVDYQQAVVEAVKKGIEEIKARHKHLSILRSVKPSAISEMLSARSTPRLKPNSVYQAVVQDVKRTKKSTRLRLGLSSKLKGWVDLDEPTKDFRVGHVLAVRFQEFRDKQAYFVLDDDPELQAASVVIENRTGYVRALVGGSPSEERFRFNRATQARRQPGSAFKPIVYATAIERKSYTPATILIDEPIEVDLDGDSTPQYEEAQYDRFNPYQPWYQPGMQQPPVVEEEEDKNLWSPKNAGGKYHGPISLRRAVELSRNVCTVKVLMDVGFDPVLEMARNMGITSKLGRNLSLSLGTSEVSLFELTAAYSVFPNGGIYIKPVLIKRIEDRHGNILEDNTEIPVLSEEDIPTPSPREEFQQVMRVEGPPAQYEQGPAYPTYEDEFVEQGPPDFQPGQPWDDGTGFDRPAQAGSSGRSNPLKEILDGLKIREDVAVPVEPREIRAAMSPQTAYIVTDILLGGVRSGTGSRMKKYLERKDIAGKTGTTNYAADAWFVGFNPDFTTGVWVGFDEKRPLGPKEYGGRAALPIWGYAMREILKDKPEREFPVPPDVSFVEMLTYHGNARDGFAATTVREPVYAPFVGRTLVINPIDAEVFNPQTEYVPGMLPQRNFNDFESGDTYYYVNPENQAAYGNYHGQPSSPEGGYYHTEPAPPASDPYGRPNHPTYETYRQPSRPTPDRPYYQPPQPTHDAYGRQREPAPRTYTQPSEPAPNPYLRPRSGEFDRQETPPPTGYQDPNSAGTQPYTNADPRNAPVAPEVEQAPTYNNRYYPNPYGYPYTR